MAIHEVLHDQWVACFRAFTSEDADKRESRSIGDYQPMYEVMEVKPREYLLSEIAADLKSEVASGLSAPVELHGVP